MLAELIERLEKAIGPDRELDEAIHAATNKPLRAGLRWGNIPNYTASIDAAVALTERVGEDASVILPDALEEMFRTGYRPERFAECVAIALCLAILKAKEDSA